MRITTPVGKVAAVVVGYIIVLLAGLLAVVATGSPTIAAAATIALLVGLLVLCTRTFRGAGEPVEPSRPWWRLTGGPPSGFVMAALFALQGISYFLVVPTGGDDAAAVAPIAAPFYLLVAAAFVYSSVRQLRMRKRGAA
ncbi:hypothetical protein [Marisediminicola senii]|uniref:hypothetical protein n=1 Tax=Marisediminicola senii TaxID=2711233 RepID=UPI0013EE3DB5|nr:hypothetical protein [Marisediminicola senii]